MNRLAVFARWPEPGRVKTRLSPALPPELARDLHRAMLEDTLEVARSSGADRLSLHWAEAPGPGAAGASLAREFEPHEQRGGDLGSRLERAFAELLRDSRDRAVIVGTDCPALGTPTLREAFVALESRDLVLGPARDGGYYLVGLSKRAPALFQGIAWGTGRVMEQTLERARGSSLSWETLATLDDLDTAADLTRWIALAAVGTGNAPAPRTREALRAIGLLPARA